MLTIALDKRGYSQNIFLSLHENICCGYSLGKALLMITHKMFREEIRKISIFFGGKKCLTCSCVACVFQLNSPIRT